MFWLEGIPLSYDVVDFYYVYGLALMELGYCGDAVPIAQSIIIVCKMTKQRFTMPTIFGPLL